MPRASLNYWILTDGLHRKEADNSNEGREPGIRGWAVFKGTGSSGPCLLETSVQELVLGQFVCHPKAPT